MGEELENRQEISKNIKQGGNEQRECKRFK
jgi:hypothetical protein